MKTDMKHQEKKMKIKKFDTSILSLIVANAIPLIGNLFFGWSLLSIMLIFWLESGVIGFYTILKMLKVPAVSHNKNNPASTNSLGDAYKAFMIPFFFFHFGGFMLGHLFFILAIFRQSGNFFDFSFFPSIAMNLLLTTISLFISHGISYRSNFIEKEEYKKTDLGKTMLSPYKRIIIMHLTILLSGFLIIKFSLPSIAVVILVILKIFFDIIAHNREHKTRL